MKKKNSFTGSSGAPREFLKLEIQELHGKKKEPRLVITDT